MNFYLEVKKAYGLAIEKGIEDEIKQAVFVVDYLHDLIELDENIVGRNIRFKEEVSDDLLFMAYEAYEPKKQIFALQSFKLNRYNYDALLVIVCDMLSLTKRLFLLKILLNDATNHLHENGYFEPEYEGSFWGIMETRPYMRLKDVYIQALFYDQNYYEAIEQAKEALYLCKNDNIGIRFIYMTMLCITKQYQEAINVYQTYQEDVSPFFIIPASIAYFNLNEKEKAKTLINKMTKLNKHFSTVLFNPKYIDLDNECDDEKYIRGGIDEMYLAISDNSKIIFTDLPYYEWLKKNYIPNTSNKKLDINLITKIYEDIYQEPNYRYYYFPRTQRFYTYKFTDKYFFPIDKNEKKIDAILENYEKMYPVFEYLSIDKIREDFVITLDELVRKTFISKKTGKIIRPSFLKKVEKYGLINQYQEYLKAAYLYNARVWCHYHHLFY